MSERKVVLTEAEPTGSGLDLRLGDGRVLRWAGTVETAPGEYAGMWEQPGGLAVISGREAYWGRGAGRLLHVSLSYADHLPDWADVALVKRACFGPDRPAVLVLPSDAEAARRHPYTHHLWEPPAVWSAPEGDEEERA